MQNRLEYDGIRLVKRIRIPDRHLHPTIETQTVPTRDQILSFLSHANVRVQTIISLQSFLGLDKVTWQDKKQRSLFDFK